MAVTDPGVYQVDKREVQRLVAENKQFKQTITKRVQLIGGFCLVSLVLGFSLQQIIQSNNLAQAFVNDGKGGYIPITPLINHPVSDTQAINYAGRVVAELLSFHFLTLNEQLEHRKPLFYGDGFDNYLQSLKSHRVLSVINEKSLVITVVPSDDIKLTQKPFFAGHYGWLIEVPVITTAEGAGSQPQTSQSTIIVTLHPVDRVINVNGLQVRQFYVRD